MPTDPTPTAADFEAANRALVPPIEEAGVGIATRIARALATARAEADAAGYARGRAESAERIAVLESLLQEARATLARVQAALEAHPIAAAEARGRAEGLREAADRIRALPCLDPTHDDRHCPACDERERYAAELAATPEPTQPCSSCGDSGSVPTGAYDETEERDERVTCPACDGGVTPEVYETLCRLHDAVLASGFARQSPLAAKATADAARILRTAWGLPDGSEVAAPTPEPTPGPRSCNRHTDCDAADRDAKARGKLRADHCHDDTCEDCFGD